MNIIKRKEKGGNGTTRELARPTSMIELRNEMDRLFDRFFTDPWGGVFGGRLGALSEIIEPALDVSETDSHVVVRAEVPGVDPERIDVSVTEEALTIAGEKEETEEEREGENYFRSERRFGSFRRTIPLPTSVDPENVDAKFRNGVLRIEMKKTAPSHSRKIPVKVS